MLSNFTFYEPSFNLRPTEITGFLGNHQLQYLDNTVQQRHSNFTRVHEAMLSNPDTMPQDFSHLDLISNMAMPFISQSVAIKQQYMSAFQSAEVEIRPLLGGSIPNQPFYRKIYGDTPGLENSRLLSDRGFYFPNHEGLTNEDINQLISIIRANEPVRA